MGKPIEIQADAKYNNSIFNEYFEEKGIIPYYWKPHENPKYQHVERFVKTLKKFMPKYIDIYGWPYSSNLPDDAQQVLDACVWYYNRIWHKGINAIPYEVFHAYDLNRQKTIVHKYPICTY
jgi:hypothetical protein